MKSKILYAFCVLFFIAGLTTYTTPDVSRSALLEADPSMTAHLNMFTLHQIGLVFLAVSMASVLLALLHKPNAAYSIMTFLISWWALLYIVSWYQTGYWQSVYGLVNYGMNAILLILCSRIIEIPEGMRESQSTPLPLAEMDFRLNHKEGENS